MGQEALSPTGGKERKRTLRTCVCREKVEIQNADASVRKEGEKGRSRNAGLVNLSGGDGNSKIAGEAGFGTIEGEIVSH